MTTLTAIQATELFRQAPHRYIDVGEGQVAYRRVGTGPDVLFVHGWPVTSATYRCLLPHLAPHLTCHLIDLVGAGDSRFNRSTRIDLARHIESVRKVVDVLGLKDVAVVGHDSGGMIVRHALAADPRIRSMALVDTEQPQGLTWRFRQFLLMANIAGFEHILASAIMNRGLRRNPLLLGDCFHDRSLLDGEFEELFLAPLRDDLDRRWAAGEFARNFDKGLIKKLGEVHSRIEVPVKLVWGEDDPFFPIKKTQEMVPGFPNAQLHIVSNAKLFVHEEYPAEVADAIRPTLLGAQPAADPERIDDHRITA